MTGATTLRIERAYLAPAHAVFDAWTSEEVLTWIWDDNPTRTLIEVEFQETDGITTVHFTHSGLWNEETVRSHRGGWNKCLDNLERTLQATHFKRWHPHAAVIQRSRVRLH